ncbi:hypothetical protein HY793_04790 [Candidatus Desantisbacteria bacterium]|nr:hypothetical protein [Candidatus Desantisbacteria bacterium]
MFKVDVFVLGNYPYLHEQIRRRCKEVIVSKPEETAFVATPEDTILSKLEWYKMGNEISDRQWGDVLGVMKVQGKRLDMDYLYCWATKLEIDILLKKALHEAGIMDE